MGVDACIYVEIPSPDNPGPDDPEYLLCGEQRYTLHRLPVPAHSDDPDENYLGHPQGATHEVETHGWRFYGPGYERGPWPQIAAVLMGAHANLAVRRVWYFGDSVGGYEQVPEFTPLDIIRFSVHYMRWGRRPYDAAWDAVTVTPKATDLGGLNEWLENPRNLL